MSQVLSYLYLGGKADAKDKATLQKLKIKYILNCTPPRTVDREAGCPSYYEKEKLFVYKRIPIFDNKGEDIIAHMTEAYNFIEEGKHYGNVLVHCLKGVSRSASFVIGYLMRKNEFTMDEALAHVQMCRPVVQPNSSFLSQLETFQSTLLSSSEPAQDSKSSETATVEISIGPCMPQAAATVAAVEVVGPAIPPNVVSPNLPTEIEVQGDRGAEGEEEPSGDSPVSVKRRKL